MTEKELSRYYYLKIEIDDLQKRIAELENTGGVSGMRYREFDVMSTPLNVSIQSKLDILLDKLTERRISALEEYIKIESYISNIDDLKIRQIMRYRFMDLKTWDEIGTLMFCDRTTVSKIAKNYINNNFPTIPTR